VVFKRLDIYSAQGAKLWLGEFRPRVPMLAVDLMHANQAFGEQILTER